MHLHVALVPPLHVRQSLDALVHEVVVPKAQPLPQAGRWGRLGNRGSAETTTSSRPFDELTFVRVADMHVSLASFGMVTRADKGRLVTALAEGALVSGQVTLRFTGGCALEFPGDRSVWARLDGDLDVLAQLARNVTGSVERLGFFVDRRRFRPWLRVGTITDATTEDYLTALLAALDAYQSEPWSVEWISLMRRSSRLDGLVSEEVERIPLCAR